MNSIISRLIRYILARTNTSIRTGRKGMTIYCVLCKKKTLHNHWYGKAWAGPPRVYWRCEICDNIQFVLVLLAISLIIYKIFTEGKDDL